MNKKIGLLASTFIVGLLLTGCRASVAPVDSSNGLNGLQQRALTIRNVGNEFDATYDDVWYGVIATLQLNGFILKHADKNSGYLYGVWQNAYEQQVETSSGGFTLFKVSTSPSAAVGGYFGLTKVYKQIDVSVTLEPLAKTETLVRLAARFDNDGIPVSEGIFANRFFGLLRKEIFLRKNKGSIYQNQSITK